MTVEYKTIGTPVGQVWVAWCEDGLVSVGFVGQPKGAQIDGAWEHNPGLRCDAIDQLRAYFAGSLREFDLPLILQGSRFQNEVWRELAKIPFAETVTYGEIARRIHRPTASRAVGAANGQNPIAIVLPCHRVIGVSGKLVGYAGGLEKKERLLAMEREGLAAYRG